MDDQEIASNNACKVFKCHPMSKVPKIVICLICENLYHEADFNKYTKGQFVSGMLVICPKHHEDNLTAKLDYDLNMLDENARKIITQVKRYEKEDLRSELCNNLSLNQSKNLSEISTPDLDELAATKMENELLRQINVERQARNKLLDAIVNNELTVKKTESDYASIVKNNLQPKPKIPKILVKSQTNNNRETLGKVKNKITNDLAITINNVRENTDGLFSITCKNNNDVARVKSVLSDKMGVDYQVELEHLNLPKVKIINVDNDLSKEDLCEDISNRNYREFDCAFNIIADYKNTTGKRTLILEVIPETYLLLHNNDFKIYIGNQRCRIFDYFNINLGHNCGRANHNHNKCNNSVKCMICAGDHHAKLCKEQQKKRLNCVFYYEKFHKNRPTDHSANDTCCAYLVYKFNNLISSTDYPIQPTIQIHLSKVGVTPKQ